MRKGCDFLRPRVMRNIIVIIAFGVAATASLTELDIAVERDVSEYMDDIPKRLQGLVHSVQASFEEVYRSYSSDGCSRTAHGIVDFMGEDLLSESEAFVMQYIDICDTIMNSKRDLRLPHGFRGLVACLIHASNSVDAILPSLRSWTLSPRHLTRVYSGSAPEYQVTGGFVSEVLSQAEARRLALLDLPVKWAVTVHKYDEYMTAIIADPDVTEKIASGKLRDLDPLQGLPVYGRRSGKVLRELAADLKNKHRAALKAKFPSVFSGLLKSLSNIISPLGH